MNESINPNYKHTQFTTQCHICKEVGLIIMTLFWKNWNDNSEVPHGEVTRICKTCAHSMIDNYVRDYVEERSRGEGEGEYKGILNA